MNKITTKARRIITGFLAIALAFVFITKNGSVPPPRTYKDGPKGNNYLGYAYSATKQNP